MLRQTRGSKPRALELQAQALTANYLHTRKWDWGEFEGVRVNQILLVPLRIQIQGHCSYCDGFPIGTQSEKTIDHFRPKRKGRFPELAFEWTNLFHCCTVCNRVKGQKFHPLLLKPDEEDYAFERYFRFNAINGEIEVSDTATDDEKARAEKTIEIFRLNEKGLSERGLPTARLSEMERGRGNQQLDDLPYRFIWG